jgi:hypothetical protein
VAATVEGSGEDQSRTWWDTAVEFEGSSERMGGERLWVRISVASGRSVSRILWVVGSVCASVMPTMPQPAPSSRILRLCFERVASSNGRRGNELLGEDELSRYNIDAMYDDKTRPASLILSVS